jgi:hypothetical protein
MAQTWEQALVNSQVSVNRAVFEMNRPGLPANSLYRADEPRIDYVREQALEATQALEECLSLLPGAQLVLAGPAPIARESAAKELKFVAVDRSVMRGREHIATAVSANFAQRLARALNLHKPNSRGV